MGADSTGRFAGPGNTLKKTMQRWGPISSQYTPTRVVARLSARSHCRRSCAWHGEPLERRVLLDAAANLAAVPVTWSASDTAPWQTAVLTGNLDQLGEMHLYRFTTAEPARLLLKAHASDGNPLEGRVKLLAVTNPQSDAHVVAADQLSVAHAAAVDGWIAPGEYLVAVTADEVASDGATDDGNGDDGNTDGGNVDEGNTDDGTVDDGAVDDGAVDEALGKYDLSLQLNRAEAATSSWRYSDESTVTYQNTSSGKLSTVVPFASSAASDSFFGDSAPDVSVLVGSPTGSFVLNRSSEQPTTTTGAFGGSTGGQVAPPPTSSVATPPPATSVSTPVSAPSTPLSNSPLAAGSPGSAASSAALSVVSRSIGNFPAAAAPVGRPIGAGAAASLPSLDRAGAANSAGSPANASSGLSGSADGSDSSQEGELEYAFRKASDVLTQAIGGTLRDVRDAALVGLSEAIRFDVLSERDEEDWVAEALDAILPIVPGGAVFDAALERFQSQPAVPVSKPDDAPPANASAENLLPINGSMGSAALASLIVTRPGALRAAKASNRRREIANGELLCG